MTDSEREFGIVKTFDPLKGFGFIRRSKGKDVFVFYEDINGDDRGLSAGDEVSFTVANMPKGPRAKLVCKENNGG